MPPEITEWIPPAVIIALMISLHRSTHRPLDRLETQVGGLRDRMGRVEGDTHCATRLLRPQRTRIRRVIFQDGVL